MGTWEEVDMIVALIPGDLPYLDILALRNVYLGVLKIFYYLPTLIFSALIVMLQGRYSDRHRRPI